MKNSNKKKQEAWEMTFEEFAKNAKAEQLLASASNESSALELVNKYYYGGKTLVKVSDTLLLVKGKRGIHEHDRVIIQKGRYRFEHIPNHKDIVKQALSEGKPVPTNVLAEYPELAQKPNKNSFAEILSLLAERSPFFKLLQAQ